MKEDIIEAKAFKEVCALLDIVNKDSIVYPIYGDVIHYKDGYTKCLMVTTSSKEIHYYENGEQKNLSGIVFNKYCLSGLYAAKGLMLHKLIKLNTFTYFEKL